MGQPGVRSQISPTTAINLLGAQSSLQSSQNSFLAAWLNYYAARIRLYRELGVMQLDPNGKWIENSVEYGAVDQPIEADDSIEELPPPLPIEILEVDPASQANADPRGLSTVALDPSSGSELENDELASAGESAKPLVRMAEKIRGFVENR